jgi:neutral ceramidase
VALLRIPDRVPVAVQRIGRIVLATLPGEFTVVAGRRVAAAVAAGAGSTAVNVVTVGLANEYLSYFATPEEYESQQYEGAFTGWGLYSTPWIEIQMKELAGGTLTRSPDARRYRYRTGSRDAFGLKNVAPRTAAGDDGFGGVLVDLESGTALRDLPRLFWDDVVPRRKWEALEQVTPAARVERRDPSGAWSPLTVDGFAEDDRGLDFVTIVLEALGKTSRCAVRWLPPASVPRDAVVRLRVHRLRGDEVCSLPFAAGDVFNGPDSKYGAGVCAD